MECNDLTKRLKTKNWLNFFFKLSQNFRKDKYSRFKKRKTRHLLVAGANESYILSNQHSLPQLITINRFWKNFIPAANKNWNVLKQIYLIWTCLFLWVPIHINVRITEQVLLPFLNWKSSKLIGILRKLAYVEKINKYIMSLKETVRGWSKTRFQRFCFEIILIVPQTSLAVIGAILLCSSKVELQVVEKKSMLAVRSSLTGLSNT